MRKLFIVLALLAASLALVFSVLPLSNLAYIPATAALLFGSLALIIKSPNANDSKKTINLAFLLTAIALGFTVYKSIFTTTQVGNTEELEQKANQSVVESMETLEKEIDLLDENTVFEEDTESFGKEHAEDSIPKKKEKHKENATKKMPAQEIPLEEF